MGSLTDLTLIDAIISGLDASQFSLIGFTPGTVIAAGDSLDFTLRLTSVGASLGIQSASLTLETDINAAFGGNGDDLVFELTGDVVLVQDGTGAIPEPTTLSLLAIGGILLMRRRGR